MCVLIIFFVALLGIILDATKVIDFTKKSGAILSGIILPHIVIIGYLLEYKGLCEKISLVLSCIILFLFYSYFFWRMHIFPFRGTKVKIKKVDIMYGGKYLIKFGFWGLLVNLVLYLCLLKYILVFCKESKNTVFLIIDLIYSFCTIYGMLLNGLLRVILLNRELGIYKRILIVLISWVPGLNILGLKYLISKADYEYEYELYRKSINETRANSDICRTKYPLIMIHGIGFKDLKWFNYWGRIPKELMLNGAKVYYGQQEAWATIDINGAQIKEQIVSIMNENNCDKVNIIAHSKGGLESRYVINELKMADHVASLTTIGTPHRGSELIPFLRKMPDGVYKSICNIINGKKVKNGENHSDVYNASLELHPDYCKKFNEKYPDSQAVYYQSYSSTMKSIWGNSILGIPYAILRKIANPLNDGLVCEPSAKWGEYKGLFEPKGIKGISHGDVIDLQRKDIKGFDVCEEYIKIVKDLKDRGY